MRKDLEGRVLQAEQKAGVGVGGVPAGSRGRANGLVWLDGESEGHGG